MDMENQKDELDHFASMWDAAMEKGLFPKIETPKVNQNTSQDSFFGLVNTHPSEEISDTDKQYWNAINSAYDDVPSGVINESEHKSLPSNPIQKDTLGNDKELDYQQLGKTYSEEELNELSELKNKLYSLESKLMSALGFGDFKNEKKLQEQIKSVKKEIDDLSDSMGRAYKNDTELKQLKNI